VPDVSVVVPCHAAALTLPRLLDGLEAQTLDPSRYEVLLADPGADGGTRLIEQRAKRWEGGELRRVAVPLAGGPAVKRNAAAREARGGLLAFTDADCVPDQGWLEGGLAAAEAGAEVVQGATLLPEGEFPGPLAHWIEITADRGLFQTCNIFYERALFESLGGFADRFYRRYGLPFGEDVDLGWRARRHGARYRFDPSAVVRHPVAEQGLRAHLRAQWLARGFPELAREVPELRQAFFHRRVFLSPRSARFAGAVAGTMLARRAPAAVLLAVPYASTLVDDTAGHRVRGRLRVGGVRLLTDATRAAALAYGSARARRLVI